MSLWQYWQTLTTSETVAAMGVIIAGLVAVSGLLEKVFGVDIVGRRALRLLWKICKFFLNWFMHPFRPHLQAVKIVFTGYHLLEARFMEYLQQETAKKEQSDQIIQSLDIIKKEVTINSGSSLKDAVSKMLEDQEYKWSVLNELRDFARVTDLRLNISDESSNRMTFRIDPEKGCTSISENFLRHFGYTEKDMIGRNWNFCIGKKSLRSVREGGKKSFTDQIPYRNEQVIIDSDGNEYLCLVRGSPQFEKNQLVYFYGFVEILEDEAEV